MWTQRCQFFSESNAVPREIGKMMRPSAAISLDSNLIDMVKFADSKDKRYMLVRDALEEMHRRSGNLLLQRRHKHKCEANQGNS